MRFFKSTCVSEWNGAVAAEKQESKIIPLLVVFIWKTKLARINYNMTTQDMTLLFFSYTIIVVCSTVSVKCVEGTSGKLEGFVTSKTVQQFSC